MNRTVLGLCALVLAALTVLAVPGGVSAKAGTVTVGPNIDVSNEVGPQFETTIAVNPNNPSQIVAGSIDDQPNAAGAVRAYFSSDGGTTWGSTALPFPPPVVNGMAVNAFDPSVAWDTQGNVYFSSGLWWLNSASFAATGSFLAIATSAVQVDRSSDGGRTWTFTDLGFHPGNGCIEDKPFLAVDTNPASPFRDTIYAAWVVACQLPPGGQTSAVPGNLMLFLSRSTDHGATFSAPVRPIGPTGNGVAQPYAPDPFVGSDGTVYVAFEDPVGARIAVTASGDGGLTFGPVSTIGPAPSTHWVPIPAEPHAFFQPPGLGPLGAFVYPGCGADSSAGPHRGTLYCAWMDETATNGTDIFVAHSTDHGRTWSPRVRANDDPTGVENDQFGQWLAVDPTDGSVSLSWDDTRNDPLHLSTHIFYARSTDGGLTFSPNVQVTTAPTNEACDTCGGRFYGDYQGIAAFGGIVHPVWTDRRASVAALGEEVFTATIKFLPA